MTVDSEKAIAQQRASNLIRQGDFLGVANSWAVYREICPTDIDGWIMGIRALWRAERGQDSQRLVRAALKAFPSEPSMLTLAAQVEVAFGDLKLGEENWRSLLLVHPVSLVGLKGLANCLMAQKRWSEADECLQLALSQTPDDVSLAIAKATLSTRQGAWDEAERRWGVLKTSHPTLKEADLGLVEALVGQGRIQQATEVLSHLPSDQEGDRRTNRLAARIAALREDWRTAERLWASEVAYNRHDSSAWMQRATALTALGDLRQAQEVLIQANQSLPHHMYLRRALAQNALERRDWSDAANYWEAARAEGPERLDSWMYIVHLRRLLGHNEIADVAIAQAMTQMVKQTNYQSHQGVVPPNIQKETFEYNERIRLEAYTRPAFDWPKEPAIEVVSDVLIQPQTTWRPRVAGARKHPFQSFFGKGPPMLNGGVYRSNGSIVASAIHQHGTWAYVPDTCPDLENEPDRLSGRWLFGGATLRHLGHFLIEGTSRLWALDRVHQEVTGIVYYCGCVEAQDGGERVDATELARWVDIVSTLKAHVQALEVFAYGLQVHIITKPTKVDTLVIPAQLSGYFPRQPELMNGHHIHQAYLRSCVDRLYGDRVQSHVKIYVSRASLPINLGFFFREDLFEDNMRKEGYYVVHPEAMSFADQLILYRKSSHIVIGSGSACHVLAVAATSNQKVAILHREVNTDPVFASQIRAAGAEVMEIQAYKGSFQPLNSDNSSGEVRVGSHRTISIVDWSIIWRDLIQHQFVTAKVADNGETTHDSATEKILRRLEKHYNVPFRGLP